MEWDGRACLEEDPRSCYGGDAEPGVDYACERVGLLGTQTVEGRVRFRGTMRDPNELALAVAITVPFAFAIFDRRRTFWRAVLLVATVGLAASCAVFTRSRGGQLVFLVVLGVYFLKKMGKRGLVAGVIGAVPVLLLGGRASAEADASSMERVDAWAAGLRMFRSSPLIGVGPGQFGEHHYLTAHNSYVLTLAELGLVGMTLWVALLWLSIKVPLHVVRVAAEEGSELPKAAGSSALALLAALAGLAVGMFFLSYAYKELLWIHFGLSAALYQAIRRHAPGFRVPFGVRDLVGVGAACVALTFATEVFTRLKGG
jgi:O-antigen ligase